MENLVERVITQKRNIGQTVFVLEDNSLASIEKIKIEQPDFVVIFDQSQIEMTSFIYEWGGKHLFVGDDVREISREIKEYVVPINKKLRFVKLNQEMEYEPAYEEKVMQYWNSLMKSGRPYFDGVMYSLCNVKEAESELYFEFAKTWYRHMIYTKEHDFRNPFHTCTTASIAIIETADGYSVLRKMGTNSSFAGLVKCLGGALDTADFSRDEVDMDNMFAREISEEIGIDILDPEICQANDAKWLLVREKMAFVGVCNVVKLNLTKAQLLEKFAEHQKVDDEKEVESLLFIRSMSELDALPKNEKADYVDALYRCYFGLNAGFSWEKVGKLSNNGKNSEQFPIHSSS